MRKSLTAGKLQHERFSPPGKIGKLLGSDNERDARVEQSVTIAGGTAEVTTYHIDLNNHTGYAKAIEEIVDGTIERTYAIGHQVISQTDDTGNVQFKVDPIYWTTRRVV